MKIFLTYINFLQWSEGSHQSSELNYLLCGYKSDSIPGLLNCLFNGPIYKVAIVAGMEAMHGLNNIDNIHFPFLRLIQSQLPLSIQHASMPTEVKVKNLNMTISWRVSHWPGEGDYFGPLFSPSLFSDTYLLLCLQNSINITMQILTKCLFITLVS